MLSGFSVKKKRAACCLRILLSLLFLVFSVPFSAIAANAAQQSVPAVLIYSLAEDSLKSLLDENDGGQYILEPLTRLPDSLLVPVGNLELEPKVVGKIRYNAPVQVRVAINVDGLQQMNIVTAWRVRKIANVLVAARDIPSKTVLTEEDVYFEQREVVKIDAVFYELDLVVGLETKRPLTMGTIISRAVLTKPFVVRSGDNVAIVSRSGAIVVQVAGQAMQGGAVGDVIRVRNLGSGKTILARVEDESTVVITTAAR